MIRARSSFLLAMAVAAPAMAQDPSLGQAAVGADAGTQLGIAFSALDRYYGGKGALVGGLGGSVLGALAAAPVGSPTPALPGAVQPPMTFNMECRNFTNTVMIDGEKRELKGTACKQPDGTWRNLP